MAGFSIPLARWFYQGQVASGAKIYVYATGTTTPVTVYTDADLTTPASNPIVCDSNGEAAFFVPDTSVLRLYVTTSGGTLIRDIDPVYPVPDLSSTLLAPAAYGQCRLTKSGSNLLLSPRGGNKLTIGGQTEIIPSAGVTLSTSGLSTNTTYFVYAYMNAGTMTLEATTTGHATDATTGVETKSGDATRTLVGMSRTNGSTAWVDSTSQRFVVSYFNRRPIPVSNAFTAGRSRSTATFAELNTEIRNEFLTWADAAVSFAATGSAQIATSGQGFQTAIGIDSTSAPEDCITNGSAAGSNQNVPVAIGHHTTLSEGYHYATLLGLADAGGATWSGASAGTLRTTLKTLIQG